MERDWEQPRWPSEGDRSRQLGSIFITDAHSMRLIRKVKLINTYWQRWTWNSVERGRRGAEWCAELAAICEKGASSIFIDWLRSLFGAGHWDTSVNKTSPGSMACAVWWRRADNTHQNRLHTRWWWDTGSILILEFGWTTWNCLYTTLWPINKLISQGLTCYIHRRNDIKRKQTGSGSSRKGD